MSFILVDIGASFLKCVLFDPDKTTLENMQCVPFPDVREIDPNEVAKLAVSVIDRQLAGVSKCRGILFSGQMHGVVLVDASGKAESRFFSWKDQRTTQPHPSGAGSFFDVMLRRAGPESLRAVGRDLRVGTAVGTLFWLSETRALPKDAFPVTIADYVAASLCKAKPKLDATQAAGLGAYDVRAKAWHRPMIAALGLEGLKWPEVVAAGVPVGEYRSIPCYPSLGDQQAALLGVGLQLGELSLNIATGSQVSCIAPNADDGDYQLRPYFGGKLLRTVTHIPAGRSLNALVSLFCELGAGKDPWGGIVERVNAVGRTDLEADLSFFPGTFGNRGSLSNLREENLTVGHVFAAAFESMARNYETAAKRLFLKGNWSRLVFSGGLARKIPALRERIVERLGGSETRLFAGEEEALLGLRAAAKLLS